MQQICVFKIFYFTGKTLYSSIVLNKYQFRFLCLMYDFFRQNKRFQQFLNLPNRLFLYQQFGFYKHSLAISTTDFVFLSVYYFEINLLPLIELQNCFLGPD